MIARDFWIASLACACVVLGSSLQHCTPADTQAQVDLNAQELACVEVSATREASRDCRNAVRAAWAKTYGVDAAALALGAAPPREGGSEP